MTIGVRPGRQFVENADIEIAVERERQRARDGGGGHHQDVGLGRSSSGTVAVALRAAYATVFVGLLHQLQALHHAEAVLLVHDDQAELGELDLLFDQSVGADDQLGVALRDVAADLALAILLPASRSAARCGIRRSPESGARKNNAAAPEFRSGAISAT